MRTAVFIAPLLLCAGAGDAQPAAAPVQTIGLYSYGYSPNPIVVSAGKAVTLHFVNRSGGRHDFTARPFFQASQIVAGSAPSGSVDLGKGQSRSVTLIPAAGRYKVHCSRPLHKMMGMTAEIVVR